METFGSYIRRARLARGWSLDEAARRIGISKSRLRELESGVSLKSGKPTHPTAGNVAAVARGMGIDQDHLAGMAGLGFRIVPADMAESALLARFRALAPDVRPVALRVLEALIEAPPIQAQAAEAPQPPYGQR
ncbi:MAG: helix-turn-helix transcriptional regulator [Candidatus Sericytochromatia bacterium]|nr:helix-turn-helix transcriptional regulator [Candidatus Sericytochromatia bacterium]